jgi:hypothetical protein
MPMLQPTKLRAFTTRAAAIFILSACAAPLARAAPVSTPLPTQISVPATVQGFMPGYSDKGLTHLVSACVGAVPVPEMKASTAAAPWHIQVSVSSIYMPQATIAVKATLLAGDHEVAAKWVESAGLNTAPRAAFCQVVSNLTQQLWASQPRIAARHVAED